MLRKGWLDWDVERTQKPLNAVLGQNDMILSVRVSFKVRAEKRQSTAKSL
jgi:hypothetical protein